MASIEGDLIVYLDSLGAIAESAGSGLWEGPPSELPDEGVFLTNYAGEPALDRVMGPSLTPPGVEVALVQVFVRDPAKDTARAKAYAYHAVLDGFDGTANGRRIFNLESINSKPFPMGQDQLLRWRYACNYRVEHEP